MGAGEGGDDFRESAEVKVDQAADGVVMVEEVVISGQGAEARGTLEPLEARVEPPAAALVSAHDGSLGTEP
jgi:hypothetical protein